VAEGHKLIVANEPELVFLDVEMGDGTGFDLLKLFPNPTFQVIFVTAHDKFAVQAFRFSAIDFLLKPVDADELIASIEKAEKERAKNNLNAKFDVLLHNFQTREKHSKRIVLKTMDNLYLVFVKDIMWCEADKNYTTFFLNDGRKILISKNLKEYEDMFADYAFYRTHNSFLVNMDYVDRIDKKDGGIVVMKNKTELPISVRKKEQLLTLLEKL